MRSHSNCLTTFSKVFKQTSHKIKSQLGGNKAKKQYLALPDGLCRQFSLAEIKAATKNFHEDMIIGQGSYVGSIYRGIIDDGTLAVAVKCFKNFDQELIMGGGVQEFRTEVQFLCQLRHPNLVPLIGFCNEKNHMILLYEYSGKGTLYDHLHGECDPLPWKQRLKICIGAARGLHYLHAGAKHAVIHRNINSSNILLDQEWGFKLSDFGYSMFGPPAMSNALRQIEQDLVGTETTEGYIGEEQLQNHLVTDESDVYSFGILLFEVLCGGEVIVPLYLIFTCIENETIHRIIDPHLKGKIAPECFRKFVEIAYSCIGKKGNEQPAMGEVQVMLEHVLELQNKADSEMKSINPHAECVYPEASFQASVDYAIPDFYFGGGGVRLSL
ncbi:receptor-like protein kinase FERONIA [Herrania umbratica]|uniref:Receptor-like protein kinase FERONIA n=1 Tax=Herrania umbratica TaxID=108875 RepID=A0A6J1BBW8_9ROSI|nr:receptor-like protein kinase FERONIA [Herrania umbratica]